jgi:hypothetical protein
MLTYADVCIRQHTAEEAGAVGDIASFLGLIEDHWKVYTHTHTHTHTHVHTHTHTHTTHTHTHTHMHTQ